MASSDSKIEKIQKQFKILSSVASSLNAASDELTKAVAILDEAMKKLNIGLTAWVTFLDRCESDRDSEDYDEDQIGYAKVRGTWGIALRRIWGNPGHEEHNEEGPWLFNDAPRRMRLSAVDKIPEVIDALSNDASKTTEKILQKTHELREFAGAIDEIASTQKTASNNAGFASLISVSHRKQGGK